MVGLAVGFAVGVAVGLAVGFAVGAVVGLAVGFAVGVAVGVGVADGLAVAITFGVGVAIALDGSSTVTSSEVEKLRSKPSIQTPKTYRVTHCRPVFEKIFGSAYRRQIGTSSSFNSPFLFFMRAWTTKSRETNLSPT